MVQVTFDTNTDTLEELEHARSLLENTILRRKGQSVPASSPADMKKAGTPATPTRTVGKMDVPFVEAAEEETAIDTPFLKITVKSDDTDASSKKEVPTLNELLNEQLSEDELRKLYKEVIPEVEKNDAVRKMETSDGKRPDGAFIEIIEYEEEK